MRRYKLGTIFDDKKTSLPDLPTVSLCIPARNETHALEDCLHSAIASDYPKLEIIVLDDCSQNRRTSQIIRGFAHDGVRFVQGEFPSDGWLGKNNAYHTLASEARGSFLVFMSVDTRLQPETLSKLVQYMQQYKLSMASVLPARRGGLSASTLFAPLRYFWQLVLPRSLNVPTSTSLWAIHSDALEKLGGIKAFKDKIMIENSLARRLFAKNTYRFLVANHNLPLDYAKSWHSQVETSLRLWYPRLHKNSFFSLLAILAQLFLFVLPLISLLIGIFIGESWLIVASMVSLLLSFGLFFSFQRATTRLLPALIASLFLPLIALQETVLIGLSVYRYKRGQVDWKGRNVCYPVYDWHENSV